MIHFHIVKLAIVLFGTKNLDKASLKLYNQNSKRYEAKRILLPELKRNNEPLNNKSDKVSIVVGDTVVVPIS